MGSFLISTKRKEIEELKKCDSMVWVIGRVIRGKAVITKYIERSNL
jgi:hypothetical protein